MTIELTDLDTVPDELVPSAFTLVAVRGPSGPVKYKAPIGTSSGYSGASINSQGHLILTRTDGTNQDLGMVAGLAGPGFVSAAINGSGHLVLTKTDGTTQDLGSVGGGGSATVATTSTAGLVKPDGTTLTVQSDGTVAVVGNAVADLTDISSGSLGGPALSDIDALNRGGTDYKTTLAARTALFRKTPAGSRTITLATGSTTATLTAADNDKTVVVAGIAGTLAVDGTITDGFACRIKNRSGSTLAVTGITLVGGLAGIPTGTDAVVSLAASTTEAIVIDPGAAPTDVTGSVASTDVVMMSRGGLPISAPVSSLPGGGGGDGPTLTSSQVRTASLRALFNGSAALAPYAAMLTALAADIGGGSGVKPSIRFDLRALYGAPLDGTSHPMTQAAALARYPNCGATDNTMEQDTAACLQAEYDLRTGSNGMPRGGIIGLPDFANGIVSHQIYLQDAQNVWLWGGRSTILQTQLVTDKGIQAICVSACFTGGTPLKDLIFYANGVKTNAPSTTSGVAHTAFRTGATVLKIQYSTQCSFINLYWNGYDQPLAWGDGTYCLLFDQCRGDACNAGFSWNSPASGGLNSMERIVVTNFTFGNNNYGFYINTAFTSNGATYNQGGSFFFAFGSFDYNIVRQGVYLDVGGPVKTSAVYLTNNHIETTNAVSGTSRARFQIQGEAKFMANEFSEQNSGVIGYIEMAPQASVAVIGNRSNQVGIPWLYGTGTDQKYPSGYGNTDQNPSFRPILLRDGNGTKMQTTDVPIKHGINYDGQDGYGLPLSVQNGQVAFYYDGATGTGTFTIPYISDPTMDHITGTTIELVNLAPKSYPVTVGAAPNVAFNKFGNGSTINPGGRAILQCFGHNDWGFFATSGVVTP